MAVPDLILDPSLQTWVLFPVLIVMVLVGVIRHFATMLLAPDPPQMGIKELREASYMQLGRLIRVNGFNLDETSVSSRVQYLVQGYRKGAFLADPEAKPQQSAMPNLSDPKQMENMTAGVKQQMLTFIPQTVIMSWISAFFGGFIVMKLPFPLTSRFKEMLQAGITTPDLDVRWVSSISWYIILLIGLQSLFTLILGEQNASSAPTATGPPAFAPNVDKKKIFESEADQLDIMRNKCILSNVVKRVLDDD